jgi:uncharacterized membrane protein
MPALLYINRMAPLIVQLFAWLLLRTAGWLGIASLNSWRDSGRMSMAVLLLFTGVMHFAPMKEDMRAMIPPPLPQELWIIYATGLLEIAGAIALLIRKLRRTAGIALILFLLAVLPANIYAALHDVPLRGNPPTPLAVRIPLQFFWIGVLWWTSVTASRPNASHHT